MSEPLTRVHDVVEDLLTLMRAAVPEGVEVADGPQIGVVLEQALCVGFSESPESPGYETAIARQDGLGRPRYVEQFTIRCFLTIGSGDTDAGSLRRHRIRAVEVLGGIDTALRDQARKPGTWDRALLGPDMRWTPVIDEEGSLCNVMFSVVGASIL